MFFPLADDRLTNYCFDLLLIFTLFLQSPNSEWSHCEKGRRTQKIIAAGETNTRCTEQNYTEKSGKNP